MGGTSRAHYISEGVQSLTVDSEGVQSLTVDVAIAEPQRSLHCPPGISRLPLPRAEAHQRHLRTAAQPR
eukprot:1179048-Prorocentrum_minimum.AAC.4